MNDTQGICDPSKSAAESDTKRRDSDHDTSPQQDQIPERNGGGDPIDRSREFADDSADQPREIGGRKGLDPVRFGDWEKNGRCIDF